MLLAREAAPQLEAQVTDAFQATLFGEPCGPRCPYPEVCARLDLEAQVVMLRQASEPPAVRDTLLDIIDDLRSGKATCADALRRLVDAYPPYVVEDDLRERVEDEAQEFLGVSSGAIRAEEMPICPGCYDPMAPLERGEAGRPRTYCRRRSCAAGRKLASRGREKRAKAEAHRAFMAERDRERKRHGRVPA